MNHNEKTDQILAQGPDEIKKRPDDIRFSIAYGSRLLQREIAEINRQKGWSDECNIPEKLCLIHSEISEALECYRAGNVRPSTTVTVGVGNAGTIAATFPIGDPSKPEGIIYEMADAVIRCFHLADMMGGDLGGAILAKMDYNRTRPYRHGDKVA